MNNRRLLSEYYKGDGSCAQIFRVTNGDQQGFYSITFSDPQGHSISQEDYPHKALGYVEDAAENWTLGIKLLLG
jgi:hypothetical protein|tara:strand:+ start:2097 stop:2318 length:222 start_codon:yes stop_codon:yes gene_type:complete